MKIKMVTIGELPPAERYGKRCWKPDEHEPPCVFGYLGFEPFETIVCTVQEESE